MTFSLSALGADKGKLELHLRNGIPVGIQDLLVLLDAGTEGACSSGSPQPPTWERVLHNVSRGARARLGLHSKLPALTLMYQFRCWHLLYVGPTATV